MLIGVSGQPGAFTEPAVRAMAGARGAAGHLPALEPDLAREATPAQLLAWTEGRAIVAPAARSRR